MKNFTLIFFSLMLGLYANSAQAINCTRLWTGGFPDPGHTRESFECTQYSSTGGNELYYSNSLSRDSINSLLSAAQEAMDRSVATYRALGTMPAIKAVVYHRPSFKDPADGSVTTYAEAFLDWTTTAESCPVIIYPAALTFSPDYFKQLMAHEIFHCFQKQNITAQTQNGTRNSIGLWWLEGIAQYFSNVVYPSVDLEYSSMFDPYIPTQDFFSQQYGNVHFFQSWANHSSNQSLIDLMRSMPTGASPSQSSALSSVASVDERLHDFAKEMITASLRDSSGSDAPLAPLDPQGTYTVPGDEEHWQQDIPITSFTINYFKINLPKKARFTLSAQNTQGMKISIKHQDEMNWRELTAQVETPCDLDETYDIAITRVSETMDLGFVTLEVDQEEKNDCPCEISTPPRDSCLYGSWDVDISTVRAFYERMMSSAPGAHLVEFSGAMNVIFNRDGTGVLSNSNIYVKMEVDSGRNLVTMINQMWGSTQWRYTTHGRGNICSQDVSNNLQGKATVIVDGQSRTVPIDPRMFSGATVGREFTYECHGNQFIYKVAKGVGPGGSDLEFNYIFNKR